MPLDQKKLVKPIRKIRKAIKGLPETPSPDQVHGLRTQSRRLEAIVLALRLEQTKRGKSLLKHLTPIRKAAGKVRDMDVLIGLASTVSCGASGSGEDRIHLIEALGEKRLRFAKRLHHVAAGDEKLTFRSLRRFSARISRWVSDTEAGGDGDQTGRTDPTTYTISHFSALSAWPKLNRRNLHSFRLAIKELRYALELAVDPDLSIIQALAQTKDAIGEWHDWHELERQARGLLGSCDVVTRIHSMTNRKFDEALYVASNFHRTYFGAREQRECKRQGFLPVKEPILISAARMSA